MIEQMKHMKDTLMNCVQGQLGDLSSVDAEELGEAMDMIKDLSEAIYYCTITESMEKSDKEKKEMPMDRYYPMTDYNRYYRDMDRGYGAMYYTDYAYDSQGGSRGYRENQPRDSQGRFTETRNYDGNSSNSSGNQGGSRNYPIEIRDYREGRSPMTRKTYMERKMHGGAKEAQMHELEKYMQELTSDITEMIEGASSEEKQMLKTKISALATKIV